MSLIQEITNAWSWVGIEPINVVGENDFGNLMIEDSQGRYWRLCSEDAYCEIVAHTREELDSLSTNQDFLNDWYMQNLVDKAKEKLGSLDEGYKYHLVISGALGGTYDISNIAKAPLVELIRLSGDIALQIKDLPDGTSVELKVVD